MTRLALAVVLLVLPGCNTIIGRLPSVEHCQHVSYQRDFNHVQITADCEI